MAQRFDELFTEEQKARVFEERQSAPFSGPPAAIILLHPVKVVPKVWYSVGIDLIEAGLLHLKTATDFFCLVGARGFCINCVTGFCVSSSAAGLSCTGLKCHTYYEFNTANAQFYSCLSFDSFV